MGTTAAERQKAYRDRRPDAGENGERRLNTWISTGAALALKRLAARYGVTQREMLERLLVEDEKKILKTLEPESPEWDKYFIVTQ